MVYPVAFSALASLCTRWSPGESPAHASKFHPLNPDSRLEAAVQAQRVGHCWPGFCSGGLSWEIIQAV